MIDVSRRSFLRGSLTFLAVTTFEPSVSALANIPGLWGDGKNDDTSGIAAILRNEPVVLHSDRVAIESHGGCIVHSGRFLISRTIPVPDDAKIVIEKCEFYGPDLDASQAFFSFDGVKAVKQFAGNRGLIYTHRGPKSSGDFLAQPNLPYSYVERVNWNRIKDAD